MEITIGVVIGMIIISLLLIRFGSTLIKAIINVLATIFIIVVTLAIAKIIFYAVVALAIIYFFKKILD